MNILTLFFLFLGFLFMIFATLGALKFPDFFTRMAAISKASTLGLILMVLAAALHFANFAISMKAFVIIIFFLVANPIAAHLLGRSAYRRGVRLYTGTQRDDYRGTKESSLLQK